MQNELTDTTRQRGVEPRMLAMLVDACARNRKGGPRREFRSVSSPARGFEFLTLSLEEFAPVFTCRLTCWRVSPPQPPPGSRPARLRHSPGAVLPCCFFQVTHLPPPCRANTTLPARSRSCAVPASTQQRKPHTCCHRRVILIYYNSRPAQRPRARRERAPRARARRCAAPEGRPGAPGSAQ